MSSDDGIYLSRFTITSGSEYRVCECAAIENLSCSNPEPEDAHIIIAFDSAKSHKTIEEARTKAKEPQNEIEYTEYGIVELLFPRPFHLSRRLNGTEFEMKSRLKPQSRATVWDSLSLYPELHMTSLRGPKIWWQIYDQLLSQLQIKIRLVESLSAKLKVAVK